MVGVQDILFELQSNSLVESDIRNIALPNSDWKQRSKIILKMENIPITTKKYQEV